jgi:hypothetical protein
VRRDAILYTLVLVVRWSDGASTLRDLSVHMQPEVVYDWAWDAFFTEDGSPREDLLAGELLLYAGHVRAYPPPLGLLAEFGVAAPHHWYPAIDVDGECVEASVRVSDVMRAVYTRGGADQLFHEEVPRWRRLAFAQIGVIEDPERRLIGWAPGCKPRKSRRRGSSVSCKRGADDLDAEESLFSQPPEITVAAVVPRKRPLIVK